MRIAAAAAALAFAGAAAPSAAQETQPAPARQPAAAAGQPSAAEQEQLRRIAERGHLLFRIDNAARLTTRDLLPRLQNARSPDIAGWIAERDADGIVITYYADAPGGPVAVYRARVAGTQISGQELFAADARPPLSAEQRRLAAARAAAGRLDRERCGTAPFNVFVIPPESADGPVEVYKLSPLSQRARFPTGGHYLATIAPDGSIASSRAFANRCLDLQVPAVAAAGARPRPLSLVHILDPLPTEIHVFLSYLTGRPIVVATGEPERVWIVERGRIGLIPPPSGPRQGR